MPPVRVFFLIAFALTWSIGGIGLLVDRWRPDSDPLSTSGPLYYVAAYSVSLTGIVLTARYAGRDFIPGMPQTQVFFPLFALGVISIAIFDTAVYLRTGANLFLAILIHLLANVGGGFALDAHALSYFFAAEAIVAALVVAVGGLSRPRASPRPMAETAVEQIG